MGVCGIMNVRGITLCVPVLLRKEGNVLFNDALNTFYLHYGVTHIVKDYSDREKGNLLLPHGLLFRISS